MLSQYQQEQAAEIAQFVIENGRVTSDNGDWNESLRGEVESECDERGLEDCAEIAEYAANQFAS